jgi:hypothetical protein
VPHALDHFMWAGPDLDAAIASFERLSGVRADRGGVHPGLGTRNALAALGDGRYLEIIAPDPAQDLAGTFGAAFVGLSRPRIFAFIARSAGLERLKHIYAERGFACDGPFEATRDLPGGGRLRWRLLLPDRARWGFYAPMFIDWLDSPHPAAGAASGCALEAFEIGHPEAEALSELYRALDMPFQPLRADAPFMRATLATPLGRLVLTGG